jgi:DNA-binding response OmpR family regulator
MRPSLLLVDDDLTLARSVARLLSKEWQCTIATEARVALNLLRRGDDFDVILCDLAMPDLDGIDFHAAISEEVPSFLERLVFMTGGAVTERACAFIARVENIVLDKPVPFDELMAALRAHSRPSLVSAHATVPPPSRAVG